MAYRNRTKTTSIRRAQECYCGFEVLIECGVCYASGPLSDQQHTAVDIEVFDGLNARNWNEVNTAVREEMRGGE